MLKRDLLREVLSVFGGVCGSFINSVVLITCYTARSKTLTKLALDWQDMLKKATNDEAA